MEEKSDIPRYTINQKVYIADYDNFRIFAGLITRRVFNSAERTYKYVLEKDGECKSFSEEDVHPTFDAAKSRMEDVVNETLDGVKKLRNEESDEQKPARKPGNIIQPKKAGVRHKHELRKDQGVLILKSVTRTGEENTCYFDTANFKIIKKLEKRFRAAKTTGEKEAIFKELKDLDCIKKAFKETKCLGSRAEGRKDYKLGAVMRPITYYAGCEELHKRSDKQRKYYR